MKLEGKDIAIIIVAVITVVGSITTNMITTISGNREIKKEIEWVKKSLEKSDRVLEAIVENMMEK